MGTTGPRDREPFRKKYEVFHHYIVRGLSSTPTDATGLRFLRTHRDNTSEFVASTFILSTPETVMWTETPSSTCSPYPRYSAKTLEHTRHVSPATGAAAVRSMTGGEEGKLP